MKAGERSVLKWDIVGRPPDGATQMFRVAVCAIALGCFSLPACAGEGDHADETVDWPGYCDDRAALSCPGFDTAACVADEVCAQEMLRDEIEQPMLDCLLQGCEWRFESCYQQLADRPLSAYGLGFREACMQRVAGCMSDDYCFAGSLLSDAALGEFAACLELPCEEIGACMDGYWDNEVASCVSWA